MEFSSIHDHKQRVKFDRSALGELDLLYPHDCEVKISLKGDEVTASSRRFKGPMSMERKVLKPVKDTLKKIVFYARSTFMERTEKTRDLFRLDRSYSDHGETDSTVTLTAHNVLPGSPERDMMLDVLVHADNRARLACPTYSESSPHR